MMMEQCFLSGDRRVVQHVRLVRLPRAARVRPCQLRRQGRRQVGNRYASSAFCEYCEYACIDVEIGELQYLLGNRMNNSG